MFGPSFGCKTGGGGYINNSFKCNSGPPYATVVTNNSQFCYVIILSKQNPLSKLIRVIRLIYRYKFLYQIERPIPLRMQYGVWGFISKCFGCNGGLPTIVD
jgi:hypothetical protein